MIPPYRHKWPIYSALLRFWSQDQGLSVVLALLLLTLFVLPPLVPPGSGRSAIGDLLFSLILIAGVRALYERKLARWVLMPLAGLTIAIDAASWAVGVRPIWIQVGTLLAFLLLLAIVLAQTFRRGPITPHRIMGGVAAYLLLGAIWAQAYALIEVLSPGAFQGPIHVADGARAWLYFSYVTLATVGYGDVLPVHPVARSLAALEAVTGTLYLTILLARLVTLATIEGEDQSRGDDDREPGSGKRRGPFPPAGGPAGTRRP